MKKRFSKRGFTLAEMLIAVLLLGFVSALVTVMTSVILNSTIIMQEVAQAEVLGSEALDNLQGQLRTAQEIKIDATGYSIAPTDPTNGTTGKLTFNINESNQGYTFDIEDGKIVLKKKVGENWKSDLLFAGVSYGNNLTVSQLKFERGKSTDSTGKEIDTDTIKITVEISYNGKALWSGSVTVQPLNGVNTSTTSTTPTTP